VLLSFAALMQERCAADEQESAVRGQMPMCRSCRVCRMPFELEFPYQVPGMGCMPIPRSEWTPPDVIDEELPP